MAPINRYITLTLINLSGMHSLLNKCMAHSTSDCIRVGLKFESAHCSVSTCTVWHHATCRCSCSGWDRHGDIMWWFCCVTSKVDKISCSLNSCEKCLCSVLLTFTGLLNISGLVRYLFDRHRPNWLYLSVQSSSFASGTLFYASTITT